METLYIVIPCYNEREVLRDTAKILKDKISDLIERDAVSPDSRIVFVDDGSKDETWDIISSLHEEDPNVFAGIKLAHNCGQQSALLGGLMTVKDRCDITVTMDADVQDDPDVIDEMLKRRAEGCEIVYGVRNDRSADSFIKRFVTACYYKLMKLLGTNAVRNAADFRLMSRKALDGLAQFPETDIYLRGVIPMIGYKSDSVYFKRKKRIGGTPSYTPAKLFKLAFDGITSMSLVPLRLISLMALILCVPTLAAVVWAIVDWCRSSPNAASVTLIASILLITTMLLFSLGILAEYVGRSYMEAKHRPRYIIEEIIGK